MHTPVVSVAFALGALVCVPAAAADKVLEIAPSVAAPASPLVSLDFHGRLRMRGHYLRDASLGNGTSGVLPAARVDSGGPDALGLGDLRLRLEPTLHIGSRARIDAQLDVTGYMVMGTEPRDESLLARTVGFAGNGPATGGLGVRRLWATWDAFGVAKLILGRTPDDFGLGILRNGGADDRADFQSEVDRVAVQAEFFGLRIHLSRDTMASLPMAAKGPSAQDPSYALQDSTDVIRWLFELHAATEGPARWGLALGYQDQPVALQLEHDPDPAAKLASGCVQGGDCAQLMPRDASLLMPQAYFRWEGQTAAGRLHLAAEIAFVAGTIATTDTRSSTDTSTTLLSGGFGAELSLRRGPHLAGLKLGLATGDSEGGFGVLDRANLTRIDETAKKVEQTRPLITGFRFHRGYLVDALLFREVIGAVANAAYLRPSWRTFLIGGDGERGLWLQGSCLVGAAVMTGSTPGVARLLGIEPEIQLGWTASARSRALLHASVLVPGSALDAGHGGTAPTDAWRLLAEWHVGF